MDNGPEELKRDIERTRLQLREDADALNEKISPRRVVGRRVERTRHAATRLRDRVMGSAETGASAAGDMAGRATAKVESAASTVGDTVTAAPTMVRERAEGSPLAAGMIAFAAGWLVAGLVPASAAERQLARTAQEHGGELAEPVKEEAAQVAHDLKEGMREPAREAVQEVRDSLTDAAATVREEGTATAQDVADETKQSAQKVRGEDVRDRRD
jgi:gas vesicle protein